MIFSRREAWNVSKRIGFALALAAGGSSHGEGWKEALGPSGSVRASGFETDKRYTGNSPVSTGSVWLNLKPEEIAGTRSYFEGYAYGENFERKFEGHLEAREAYLERAFGPLDFRIGRQINVWGRGDKVNPTDNLTVRDQRLLFTDDEEQRLGIAAAQAIWNFESFRIIGIWQPEWRRPLFAFPPLPAGISLAQRDPDDAYRQFAVKIDTSGGDFDASVSYYHGYDKTPDFALEGSGPGGVAVGLVHRPVNVVGGDFATSLGSYGVRGEAAYFFTEDRAGTDPLVKNRFFAGVLGADRNLVENLNLNAQYLVRYTRDFVPLQSISDPSTRQLASQAYFVANQTQPWLHGMSLRLNYKAFNETLEVETAIVLWVNRGDYLVRPKVSYSFSDHVRGAVGAEWYGGGQGSFFGTIKDLSTGFAELRWLY